jgi:hypothetical protein
VSQTDGRMREMWRAAVLRYLSGRGPRPTPGRRPWLRPTRMPDTPPTSEGLDLTAIKDAVAAATPMKWMGRPDGDVMTEAVTSIGDGYQPLPMLIATLGNRDDDWTADAHLIGHAPEWLTLLCDEVERLSERDKVIRQYAEGDEACPS